MVSLKKKNIIDSSIVRFNEEFNNIRVPINLCEKEKKKKNMQTVYKILLNFPCISQSNSNPKLRLLGIFEGSTKRNSIKKKKKKIPPM